MSGNPIDQPIDLTKDGCSTTNDQNNGNQNTDNSNKTSEPDQKRKRGHPPIDQKTIETMKQMLAEGKSRKQIANELNLSYQTVVNYTKGIPNGKYKKRRKYERRKDIIEKLKTNGIVTNILPFEVLYLSEMLNADWINIPDVGRVVFTNDYESRKKTYQYCIETMKKNKRIITSNFEKELKKKLKI